MRKLRKFSLLVFLIAFIMVFFAGCSGSSAKETVIDEETFNDITVSVIKREDGDKTETYGKIISYNNTEEVIHYTIPAVTPKGIAITKIGGNAFYKANIQGVKIPEGITDIEIFAFGYSKLTLVDIPASIKTIGEYAFVNCASLGYVTINASTPPSLGGYAFRCLDEKSDADDPYIVPARLEIFVPDVAAYTAVKEWNFYASCIKKNS